jgi:hypothetical protein
LWIWKVDSDLSNMLSSQYFFKKIYHLEFFSVKLCFCRSFRLFLKSPSRSSHIKLFSTWFFSTKRYISNSEIYFFVFRKKKSWAWIWSMKNYFSHLNPLFYPTRKRKNLISFSCIFQQNLNRFFQLKRHLFYNHNIQFLLWIYGS